ncbi:MAG TPA: HlyD family efflux transporter periplasmic adaptor subunit [Gemmatimonadaceae bacterium]|nr:HlyD family efflux transporter periplasmic adaptor subunit [Gemmatimonadaceae bacterium]
MDIKREPPKKTKKYIAGGVVIVGVLVISAFISKLKPAAPPVERATLWIDTVKKGEMVRSVNAPGTLVPEHIRIIVAITSGRVETLPVRPGVSVTPDQTILTLSNPDLDLQTLQDQQLLTQAYGALAQLRTSLQQGMMTQEGAVAQLITQYQLAYRNATVADSLDKKHLSSPNEVAAAHDQVSELKRRLDLERQRYKDMEAAQKQQLDISQQSIEGLKEILKEQRNRVASMRVTAGESGQLLTLGNPQLELGQWVNSGIELARVAQPGRLKAVLRVPETQAKDVVVGQRATIDLHNNGIIEGHVIRADPSSQAGTVTVEVGLDGALPNGARSDLSVDGTIEIDRLKDVLYVGRPAYGQAESTVGLFKVEKNNGYAFRTNVKLGRASVNTIEVVNGLAVGDSVIISDMSTWDNTARVKLK